jgi:hypothetical protein
MRQEVGFEIPRCQFNSQVLLIRIFLLTELYHYMHAIRFSGIECALTITNYKYLVACLVKNKLYVEQISV